MSDLDPISLEQLDENAALRERVDTKYVIGRDRLASTLDRLSGCYRVLEIDSRRSFDYESVYFDTSELSCFRDHVDNRRPRFKARSRCYRETEACFLQVKVKDAEDVTTKRQRPYDLAAALSTRYRRVTLAGREGGERVTLDLDVGLRAMDNRKLSLRDDLALIETKTALRESPFDDALVEEGCDATSISKYRLGVGLLLADVPDQAGEGPVRQSFIGPFPVSTDTGS